ncbi:MAG: disulfide bond formation protein B [Simkaniaceae bacterium]|nr:disulfide bond formation protein B [Simkaniaceae bacterium]
MKKYGLYFIWLISCLFFMGSLYLSEIELITPCVFCWYQRICLFPLVLIAGIAAFRGFFAIAPFLMPQIFIGCLISLYQLLIQENSKWNFLKLCVSDKMCSEKTVLWESPISLAMVSFSGFTLILILLLWVWIVDRYSKSKFEQSDPPF